MYTAVMIILPFLLVAPHVLLAQTKFLEPGPQFGFLLGAGAVKGPQKNHASGVNIGLSKDAMYEWGVVFGRNKVRYYNSEDYDYTKYSTITPYIEITGRDSKRFLPPISFTVFYIKVSNNTYFEDNKTFGLTVSTGKRLWLFDFLFFGFSIAPEIAATKSVTVGGKEAPISFDFALSAIFGSRKGAFLYITPTFSRSGSDTYKGINAGLAYTIYSE